MNNRLDSLFKLLEKEPDDSFILYGIALEYKSLKNFKKAEEYLLKVLEVESDYVPAYMQYAQLKEDQNEIEKAKELYKKGIEYAITKGDKHSAKEMEEFLDDLN